MWIDNKKAVVHYAGTAPGLISGMFQANLEAPAAARSGDCIPIYLNVNNRRSDEGFRWNESACIAIQ